MTNLSKVKKEFKKSVIAILELEDKKLSNEIINLICNNFESYLEHSLLTQRKDIIKRIKDRRWRKTKYGYRQKGELGTATNIMVCEAENYMLDDIINQIKEGKK